MTDNDKDKDWPDDLPHPDDVDSLPREARVLTLEEAVAMQEKLDKAVDKQKEENQRLIVVKGEEAAAILDKDEKRRQDEAKKVQEEIRAANYQANKALEALRAGKPLLDEPI
jgi:hypothetical protein